MHKSLGTDDVTQWDAFGTWTKIDLMFRDSLSVKKYQAPQLQTWTKLMSQALPLNLCVLLIDDSEGGGISFT